MQFAELDAATARLPGALASDVPELMIDYLATVFTEEDVQPVARCRFHFAHTQMYHQRIVAGNTPGGARMTFVAADCREPVGDNAGTWSLLEGYLSDDPDSAAVTDDLMGMAKAAEMTRSAIAGIQRLEIASTQNLGYLDPKRDR